jgi:hypothetical protein
MRFTRILLLVSLIALIAAPIALALRFTDESYNPPIGETGKAYSWSFTGAGGCGPALPYQFRLLGSTMPPGLTLDSSGLVHGVPTSAGDYSVWVELSDQDPPSAAWCTTVGKAQREFKFKILQGLTILQRQPVLQVGFVNQAYSQQFTAEGGGTQTWSVGSGSLPAGLSLNSSTGLLSGTPTQAGDSHFQIKVTDGNRSSVQTYTLPVVEALKITSPTRATALVGKSFTLQLTASGGRTPYRWSAEVLPAGFTLNADTGAITGTSETPSSNVIKVTVTDALGLQQTVDVNLSVGAKLAIVRGPLPTLKVGKKYSARLTASGGVAPRTWAILGGRPGTLPPGIKFNKRTGVFSGTPTKAGTWRLRMQATDATGAHAAVGILLKVLP